MNVQHERILGIIADLAGDERREVDEFSVAAASGAIPERLPRHAWVNHPCRGDLLRVLTCLDQGKLIYVTKRGYWGLYLTKRGYQCLAERAAGAAEGAVDRVIEPIIVPAAPDDAQEQGAWQAPRPASVPLAPRHDHFYSTLALAIAGLGALLIFAFGQSTYSPLARESAAASGGGYSAAPTALIVLPSVPTVAPTAIVTAPVAPPERTFIVANTGDDGVFLRRSPKIGDRLGAWADTTALEEIGPEQTLDGTTWRHVRAPDGTEGYVPAQYTALAE